jgi:hypothetical protein
MKSIKGHRIFVKFCFKVRKTAAETHSMLCEAYSYDALSQIMTYKWFRHFKNGSTLTDDDEWSGRISTSKSELLIAQVNNIINGNHQLTV